MCTRPSRHTSRTTRLARSRSPIIYAYGKLCTWNAYWRAGASQPSRIYTVEPLIMDTPKSRQPPYNGQTVRPLPIYCPYISTSEEGTTSKQWTKCSSPTCPLFGGSTVYDRHDLYVSSDGAHFTYAHARSLREMPTRHVYPWPFERIRGLSGIMASRLVVETGKQWETRPSKRRRSRYI